MTASQPVFAEFEYGGRKQNTIFEITNMQIAVVHGIHTRALYFRTFNANPKDVTATFCSPAKRHNVSGRHFTSVSTIHSGADIARYIDSNRRLGQDTLERLFSIESSDYKLGREFKRAVTPLGLIKVYQGLPEDARVISLHGRDGRILLEPDDVVYDGQGRKIWPETNAPAKSVNLSP